MKPGAGKPPQELNGDEPGNVDPGPPYVGIGKCPPKAGATRGTEGLNASYLRPGKGKG
jgi:hypothetical protein